MPQAPEAKKLRMGFAGGLKMPLGKLTTPQAQVFTKAFGLSMTNFAVAKPTARDQTPDKQPHIRLRISLCKKRCKKSNAENKPYSAAYVFTVALFKRLLSSTLSDLGCRFQQSLTRRIKARRITKSVIKAFGHVSGKIWTSIFRVRPFSPFSRPFPPLSVL